MVGLLLDAGADANKAKDGVTPLIITCRDAQGGSDIITALIEYGADVNAADNAGWTPLMYLANKGGYTNLMTKLVKAGADINRVNSQGKTALDIMQVKYPDKYSRWIENTVNKPQIKRLEREDIQKAADTGFEFDI